MSFDKQKIMWLMSDLRVRLEGKFGFTRMAERYSTMTLRSGEESLWIDWKTCRGWCGVDDTSPPSAGFEEIVNELATRHGFLYRKWEPCEKGWGDFIFVAG